MNISPGIRRARGFVLLTAMVMLLILTIVSVYAMTLIGTQRHVAANAASMQIAMAQAQAANSNTDASVLQQSFPVPARPCYQANDWASTVCGPSVWPQTPGNQGAAAIAIEELPAVTMPGESAVAGSYPGTRTPVYRVTTTAANAQQSGAQATIQETVH